MNKIEVITTSHDSRDIGMDIVDSKTGNGLIIFRGQLQGNKSEEGFRKAVLAQFPEAIEILRKIATGYATALEKHRAEAVLAVIDQPLN